MPIEKPNSDPNKSRETEIVRYVRQYKIKSDAPKTPARHDGMIRAAMEESVLEANLVKTLLRAGHTRILSMSDGNTPDDDGQDGGLATAAVKPALKRPPMYKVILLNDDYTPMEFVVHILERFFAMDREKATQIMLAVHTEGAATVGIYPRDVAETKSEQVNLYSQENNHPLMSTVEMTDTE